ncbi:CAP domain-containing protein [Xylariales sp. AK1849]|nr:CAP domain-containing protein [Xylariales sp. AK1849]
MSDNHEQQQAPQPEPEIPCPPLLTEEDKSIHGDPAETSEPQAGLLGNTAHINAVTAHASLNADQAGALKVHNDVRAKRGLKPLVWDNALAQHAQQWANHLVQIDKMVHSSGDQRPGEGENLAASNGVKNPLTGGAQMWMNEAKDYHGEPIGQGDFSKYGHYTQCMWKSTTKVGMASAKTSKGAVYTVGRYSPPGNWTGQKPY